MKYLPAALPTEEPLLRDNQGDLSHRSALDESNFRNFLLLSLVSHFQRQHGYTGAWMRRGSEKESKFGEAPGLQRASLPRSNHTRLMAGSEWNQGIT